MTQLPNNKDNFQTKTYNKPLDVRTLEFAKSVIHLCKKLVKTTIVIELVKQVTRSSCSIGANYREANGNMPGI